MNYLMHKDFTYTGSFGQVAFSSIGNVLMSTRMSTKQPDELPYEVSILVKSVARNNWTHLIMLSLVHHTIFKA